MRPSERKNKFGYCPVYNTPRENNYVRKVAHYNRDEHTAGEIRRWGLTETWMRYDVTGKVELKDLPEDPCYRCGWFILSTDWIYGLAGKDEPFYKACALHDDLYTPELRPPGLSRKEADDIFLESMKTIIREENKGSIWIAYTYYYLARALGGMYWDA